MLATNNLVTSYSAFSEYDGKILVNTGSAVVCTAGKYPSIDDCDCAAGDTKCLSGPPDCTSIKKETPKEDCPCPDKTDKTKWDADPRTKTKDDICASGSIKVFLSAITAAVVIPALVFSIERRSLP
ncbi:MAG: hypothetical protein EZS28_047592, partial [Streblomastix strix]